MIDAIGWVGTLLVLVAYALVTRRGVSRTYQALNLAGAICLGLNTAYHHSSPSVALNVAWAGIAIYGLVNA